MEERSIEEILTAYCSKGLAAEMGLGVRPPVIVVGDRYQGVHYGKGKGA